MASFANRVMDILQDAPQTASHLRAELEVHAGILRDTLNWLLADGLIVEVKRPGKLPAYQMARKRKAA